VDHVSEPLSTIIQRRFDPSPPFDGSFVIEVRGGPDAGRTAIVDDSSPSRALIGTGPACMLRLSDREVSRRHAALEIVGERLRLLDLDSTNGTYVNGVAVNDAWLVGGETIVVGGTELQVRRDKGESSTEVPTATGFGRVVGSSREMRRLYPLCVRIAASTVPVIIEGETGTGKEILAESLHEASPVAQGPFVVFDCTAVPSNLVESELFGHERGAFTGAVAARSGVFEQAHGGTLLIDEIGDLDVTLQPKLLRALERGEIRRIGGDRSIRVSVRIMAATRRDLDHEVQVGRFRDDLFHRLAVARIELPPLRTRRADVAVLAKRFWHDLGGATPGPPAELLSRWEDSPWPGNVRELRNAVSRRIALGDLAEIPSTFADDPNAPGADPIEAIFAKNLPFVQARRLAVEQVEQRYLVRILAEHGGNVTKAAHAAGIARRYFQRLRAKGR
jgi:DNA-binding NtrC family response regulator